MSVLLSALAAVRRQLASATKVIDGFLSAPVNTPKLTADDLDADWIDLRTAAERFGKKQDTLRHWCRKDINKPDPIGRLHAGRWQVNVKRLRVRLER